MEPVLSEVREEHMENWGSFCEIFGINPRNRVLEFFLEMKELDFTAGDIAKETGLNRATTYNIIEELVGQQVLVPTRKVSGGQLYKLNAGKNEVKILIEVFNLVLKRTVEGYGRKKMVA